MLELLSNKVTGLKAGNFIKKRLQHRCFPVNIGKLLRTDFLIEHHRWLLLSELTVQYWASVSTNKSSSSNQSMFFTCSLLNVYFNDVQLDRWLHLSSSLWRIPLCCDVFRRRQINYLKVSLVFSIA